MGGRRGVSRPSVVFALPVCGVERAYPSGFALIDCVPACLATVYISPAVSGKTRFYCASGQWRGIKSVATVMGRCVTRVTSGCCRRLHESLAFLEYYAA